MITYEPHFEYVSAGNHHQVCKTFFNGKLLENIHHRTFFPYSWLKEVKSWYNVIAFDCMDTEYDEKLSKLKEFVSEFDAEIIEDELIFFCLPEKTNGKTLEKIDKKMKVLFDN